MRGSDGVAGLIFVGVYAVALIVSAPPLVLGLLAVIGVGVVLVRFHQRRADEKRRDGARQAYQAKESERNKQLFLDEVDCYFPFLKETFQDRVSNGEAPEDAFLDALYEVPATDIGTTMYGLPARLPLAERTKHLYIVGKTGSGKTSLLMHLIQDDLAAGRGLCVIAPEAELFRDWLLPLVPESRADSVVYFAPGHLENPVTFNPLALEPGDDRGRATGELLSILRSALGDAELGARMTPILGNIFSALLNRPNSTLWDVPRLLVDTPFREEVARATRDPYLRDFWLSTYPSYPKGAHLPILNRLDQFLRPQSVRQALCHPVSTLSIRKALKDRGILFFDLSRLDPASMLLVGQMLLSKFQLELMRREEIPEQERAPFHLYADEFQTFAGVAEGTWRELLSRGRRYGLALTLAHQHPSQLPHGLQDEILGNVASIVAFGLSAKDAEVVRKELLELPALGEPARPVAREAVISLRVGEAVARLGGGSFAVPLRGSSPMEKPLQARGEAIAARSWEHFGIPLGSRPAQAPTRTSTKAGETEASKTRSMPNSCHGPGLVLGQNTHGEKTANVCVSPNQRTQHMYVIGSSGTGKSTFLLNCIVQGLQAGEGLAVLDPHGDLIDEILARIPENRYDDVVLFDPADREWPVGFNILSAHSDVEKELLASDLVAVFQRLSSRWGDQMNSILANAILAFLESDRSGTLADLRRFLVEEDFRSAFLATVHDPDVVYYWEREFPLLAGRPQASLLTRLDTFLRPKLIRNMVSQKESRLDFADIMDSGKILLAKLSQGAIGEGNAYLLGSLLVSKFYQLAISRQAVSTEDRRPFYLYVDECHNFLTPSMASILSGARKYQLGLILAHQDLQQLSSKEGDILNAVITNPYTRICFRLGDLDAKKLEKGFTHFDAGDLQKLGVGEAICRVGQADHDFNLKTEPTAAVNPDEAKARRLKLINLSRQRYGTPRQEVEMARGADMNVAETPESPAPAEAPKVSPSTGLPPPLPQPDVQVPSSPRVPGTGHGGDQHRYVQALVKRWAESRGFRASVEQEVLSGTGRIDVALEKPGLKIAVEVSVSTDVEHEIQNIQKGLAAGFDHVAVICQKVTSEYALKDRIAAVVEAEAGARVHVVSVDGLFDLVDRLDAQTRQETSTVRGYAVKVGYTGLTREEQRARKATISTVIARALRHMKT